MIKRHLKFKTNIGYRAVEHQGVLHLSGFVADDLSQDMAGQTQQVLNKIADTLGQLGSSKDRLLSAVVFLADFNAKEAMNGVWVKWFDDQSLPTRSTIGVADLGPGVLIEVVVSAAA